jgi:hypothetical protein
MEIGREPGYGELGYWVVADAPSRRVAEKAGFRDSGASVGSPRAATDEPVFAVYVWEP